MKTKSLQLIDNLQQVATDMVDYLMDTHNQSVILKFLTGIDILHQEEKITPRELLKLIHDYFVNYAWDPDSVNTIVLYALIEKLPQYQTCSDKTPLPKEVKFRLKDLFLLRAKAVLEDHHKNTTRQKLKSALIDAFLKRKFK